MTETATTGDNSNEHLKAFVERICNLLDEKDKITEDVSEVVAEAKAGGYTPKTLRRVVREMRRDPDKRAVEDAELEIYLHALGMV